MTRRIYFDCEFLNRGAEHPVSLISIGLTDDADRNFYGIDINAPLGAMWRNPWIREHLWPHLPVAEPSEASDPRAGAVLDWDNTDPGIENVYQSADLREKVREYLGTGEIELWTWCGAFDFVLLSQLFGPFGDQPENLPLFAHDVEELRRFITPMEWNRMRQETKGDGTHHALLDALEIGRMVRWLFNVDWDSTPEQVIEDPAISDPIDEFLANPSIGELRVRPVRKDSGWVSGSQDDYEINGDSGMVQ